MDMCFGNSVRLATLYICNKLPYYYYSTYLIRPKAALIWFLHVSCIPLKLTELQAFLLTSRKSSVTDIPTPLQLAYVYSLGRQ